MGDENNVAAMDIDALFDLAVADPAAVEAPKTEPAAPASPSVAAAAVVKDVGAGRSDVYQRIGFITRALHDSLRELGYDKKIETAVRAIPDARDRLNYIASLTGRAAERVLGAVEAGQTLQGDLQRDAAGLLARWNQAPAPGTSENADLVCDTKVFLDGVGKVSAEQNSLLLDIMMAQDFHDLTGQVIKRVGELAHELESNLLQLLVETAPPTERLEETGLTGPVVRPQGRTDVVQDQGEVDALLESLGF